MPEILTRSFALVRAATGDDGRTLSIRAVPWDTEIQIAPGEWESFDRHAFDPQLPAASRLTLTLGHPRPGDLITDSLIGRLASMEARDDGLHVQARVATTNAANEALTLVNDGVLDQVSIGFVDLKPTKLQRQGGGALWRRLAARLDHLALVAAGAYGEGAKVLAVREEQEPTGPRLDDLRGVCTRLGVHLR